MRPSNLRSNSRGKFERVQQNRLRQSRSQDELDVGKSNDLSESPSREDAISGQSNMQSFPQTPHLPSSETELSPVEEIIENSDAWNSLNGLDSRDPGGQTDEIFPTERNSLSDARASRIIPTLLELESENATLLRENRNFISEKLQAEEQAVNLSRERDELQRSLDSVNRENAIMRSNLDKANSLAESQDFIYANLLEDNRKLKERNGVVTQEAADLRHRETELMQLNAELDDSISTVKIERTRLAESLSETMKKAHADRDLFQLQLSEQRDEITELRETLEAVQDHLEQAKEQQLLIEADLAEADRRVLLNRSAAASLVGPGNLANELANETMNSPGFTPITPGITSPISQNAMLQAVGSPSSRASTHRWPHRSNVKQHSNSTSAIELMTSKPSVSQSMSKTNHDEAVSKPTPTELFTNTSTFPDMAWHNGDLDQRQSDTSIRDRVQGSVLPVEISDHEDSVSGSEQTMASEERKALMPASLVTARAKPENENLPVNGLKKGQGQLSKHKPPPLPISRSSFLHISGQNGLDDIKKVSIPSPLQLGKAKGTAPQSSDNTASSYEQRRRPLHHLRSPGAMEFARRSMTGLLNLLNSSIQYLVTADMDGMQRKTSPDDIGSVAPKDRHGRASVPSIDTYKTGSNSGSESVLSIHWVHDMPSFNSRPRNRRVTYNGTSAFNYRSSLSSTSISPKTIEYPSRPYNNERVRDETTQTDYRELLYGSEANRSIPKPVPMNWGYSNPFLAYLCSLLWSAFRWTLCEVIPPWLWVSAVLFLITLRSQCFSTKDCHQWYASNRRFHADVLSWRDDIWALAWLAPIRYDMSRKWNLADTLFM